MTHTPELSFQSEATLDVNGQTFHYHSLKKAQQAGLKNIHRLPYALKILLENLLRFEDNTTVTKQDIQAIADWLENRQSNHEIAFRPARVLMQDFTGVPAVVDLAAMRAAMVKLGGNPKHINPLCPIDLVIDHSVNVDHFGKADSFTSNVNIEMLRNRERYTFLKWGQQAFDSFQLVPPGTGICHQVNLEYLGRTVWTHTHNGKKFAYPDTLVGTDSHTPMINGLGVLGWGVGGIEAEAAMLGQPISMLIPKVMGVRLVGQIQEGVTATDLVLTLVELLRKKNVVGQFVEFFGPGLADLPVTDRATISNMAPEYGATCGLFPIDQQVIDYMALGRDRDTLDLVEAYAKAQGFWHDAQSPEADYTEVLTVKLDTIQASVAGPKRPQDRVALQDLAQQSQAFITQHATNPKATATTSAGDTLTHGDVVIAAITSCTNTSNPGVMLAAGLLVRNAIKKGLQVKPWVKTSLAPGSKVVTAYYERTGLLKDLETLGFYIVGYGCTTCIGNSGPLAQPVSDAIDDNGLVVSAVLSGNRNFEGRIHPQVQANWLASPPLVIAYALAGTTKIDLTQEPLGHDAEGQAVFLKDIWPSQADVNLQMKQITRDLFQAQYADVFKGDAAWQRIAVNEGQTYDWPEKSSYIQHPPFFKDMPQTPAPISDIQEAHILALLGDSVTTDHISPAGSIQPDSPAGRYLSGLGIAPKQFNSYGSRRGNHEVMMRGTFANIRIRNELLHDVEGGWTRHIPTGEQMTIFDAAMRYQTSNTPLVIVAGAEYGTGSSRDWAAKGTLLLGVKAVIAESFERIHRSNLIGMGVLPLQFKSGTTRHTLQLKGNERLSITGLSQGMRPGMEVSLVVERESGQKETLCLLSRIDTYNEAQYYQHGGILHYVLRSLCKK